MEGEKTEYYTICMVASHQVKAEKQQRPNQARNYVPTFPFAPSDRYKLPRRANLVSVDDALAVTHESSGGATLLMYVSLANDPFSLIFTLIMACVHI